MLNGVFAIGTTDCTTHLDEEIPKASKNLPEVLFLEILVGFFTAFFYMISMFYTINDLDTISKRTKCVPSDIYLQAAGSRGGALGLLIIIILPIACASVGCYVIASKTLYALARACDAAPFAIFIGAISSRCKSPLLATFACGIIFICLGAIYVDSTAAFHPSVCSFLLLTTAAFFLSIFLHISIERSSIKRGAFWLSKFGYTLNIIACLYMVVFFVIYCFICFPRGGRRNELY